MVWAMAAKPLFLIAAALENSQPSFSSSRWRVTGNPRPVRARPRRSPVPSFGVMKARTASTHFSNGCTKARAPDAMAARPLILLLCLKDHEDRPDHHAALLANCFAQSEALMLGKDEATVRKENKDRADIDALAPQKTFPGNQPVDHDYPN